MGDPGQARLQGLACKFSGSSVKRFGERVNRAFTRHPTKSNVMGDFGYNKRCKAFRDQGASFFSVP